MKRLIVITGHSATGKTTIARQLSEQYGILRMSKDDVKERVFDGLGAKDKAWSLAISGIAHRITDDVINQELRYGRQVIVESNFKREIDSKRFTDIAAAHGAACLQILCTADPDALFDRWNARIEDGERHAGHVEEISLEEIRQDFQRPYPTLDLPGDLIEIDTTDISAIRLPQL